MRQMQFLLVFVVACGTVNHTPDDAGGDGSADAGADGGDGDAGPDAGSGPSLDLRILHTVRGERSTELFVADVVDGELGPAMVLSGPGDSAPVRDAPVSASEDGATVVFQTVSDGQGKALFVVDLGGAEPTEPVRVSTDGEATILLDQFLAPDGRAVIYGGGRVVTGFAIREQYYFVDLSGETPAAPVPLGPGDGVAGFGALSADGNTFVFLKAGVAYVVDTSGPDPSAAVRISPPPPSGGTVLEVHLSADGSRAVLVGDLETDEVFELFVVDLSGPTPGPARKASGAMVDGGDVRRTGFGFMPTAITPDGGLVAYVADAKTDGVDELFLVDTSTATPGLPVRASDPPVAGGDVLPGFGGSVELSSDGRWVAFLADTRSDGVTELFVAAPSGNVQRVSGALVDGGNVVGFAFSPDGSGLAYRADQETDEIVELFYVDLRGAVPSAPRRVNGPLGDGGAVGFSSPAIAFSPDGTRLAFQADAEIDGRLELFLATIVDGVPQPPVSVQEPSIPSSRISRTAFSADGRWLAYAGKTAGPNRELWLVDLRGESPGPAVSVNSQVATPTGVVNLVLRPGL